MFPQQHFKLKLSHQAILLAMVSAAYPVTGYCIVAGRADFVIGEVVAVAPDGIQRPLAKGAVINAGDAINTAAGARAQIRFSDGGYVSLQPGSQFRVDEYQYENKTDGNEKGFFSLLKGGLRAITGAIGRTNRNTYRVATQAATIGIRGTGYNAVQEGEGVLVNVGEGAISLTNNAGTLVVTSGEAAFVADFNTAPEFTFQKPSTPPAGFIKPLDAYFSEAEQRDAAGDLAILPMLVSGSGYALAYAGSFDGGEGSFSSVLSDDVTATFTATSQLTQYSDGFEGGALDTAIVSSSATDGIIGWGRWNGGTTTGDGWPHYYPGLDLAAGDTFHYVVGLRTPDADLLALYHNNVTATYSLMGGTRPTLDNGSTVELGNLDSGSLTVNFGSGSGSGILRISFPSVGSYTISGSGWSAGGVFYGSAQATGGSCSPYDCYTNISGFFAGANAARAGVAYNFSDIGSVAGVAAFAQ